jgi:hypothetical protein
VGVRPEPTAEAPQQPCADQGDEEEACRQTAEPSDDIPHLRSGARSRRSHTPSLVIEPGGRWSRCAMHG